MQFYTGTKKLFTLGGEYFCIYRGILGKQIG